MIPIPETDEALRAECDVETFRSSGPGGQNVNRRETAVRVRHRPTGLAVACQEERSQYRNLQRALEILRGKLEARNRRRRPRVPTRIPSGVRERIMESKKRAAVKKKRRRALGIDD